MRARTFHRSPSRAVCRRGAADTDGRPVAHRLALTTVAATFVLILFGGRKAPMNPWNSNTLEWTAPSPPPHLNWGAHVPTVYRGPYEYSDPDAREDFLPQTQAPVGAGARRH